MKKNIIFLLIMVLILSLAVGCSLGNQEVLQDKTITDSLGREVNIDKTPEKIISISPAITEMLFALGLNEEIIGVSDYCDYPADAQTKDKMGGFKNPNVEVIISKNPDVVFTSAGIQEEVIPNLEKLNIKVIALDANTIDQVMDNIELIGKITGKEEQANSLVADMKQRVETVIAKVKDQSKPKVFFEVWDDPLMTAGSSSFIHNILETAGGINIGASNTEDYFTYSMEKLLETDPDIYIINSHNHNPVDVKERNGYEVLSAIKNDKVFVMQDDLISRAGPRVIQGLEEMAKIIHPEIFADR